MSEPIPCPFCGFVPSNQINFRHEDGVGVWLEHTCDLDAGLGGIRIDVLGHNREKVIKLWNTRISPATGKGVYNT